MKKDPEKDHFFKIIHSLYSEYFSKGGTVVPLKNEDLNKKDFFVTEYKKTGMKIFYIDKDSQDEIISIFPVHNIQVCTDLKIVTKFYKSLKRSKKRHIPISIFSITKKPAIIHIPEYKTIYFLFNLEKLIVNLAILKHERDKIDKHGRFLSNFLEETTHWKYPAIDAIGLLIYKNFDISVAKKMHGIYITHDVDRVGFEPLLYLKKFIYNVPTTLRFSYRINDHLLIEIMKLAEIDSKNGFSSLWFFLSGKYSLRRYGNRYSVFSKKTKKLIDVIKQNNHLIGLHTSYYAAFDENRIKIEKSSLEKITNQTIIINRNHYLRYNAVRSAQIYENCGIKIDTTLGFSDQNGFRASTCRPIYLWNGIDKRTSCTLEIPLLFMDTIQGNDLQKSWDDILRALSWIKNFQGIGTLLFHPCFLSESEDRRQFYYAIIRECQRSGIPLLSAKQIKLEMCN